jgi:serine/threonine protein kinase
LKEYVGRTLDDRYQLVRVLGRGGMGSVFLAKHAVIGRPLAVKILDIQRMSEKREYTRLFREAQTAAAIGHPNIIDVIDVGVAPEGHPYMVMEYLDGEDVASILRRVDAFSLAGACAILEPVLLALSAAHARNIVHRDIKPANIFVVRRKDSPPTVKLIDFGIAKELGPSARAQLTLPGALLGTPSYMPPEQATGVEDVDTRADIYGVGITLYEMLTNKLPFVGANYNEMLYRIVTDEAPPPVSPIEELPEQLLGILQVAMHKDPEERFQTAIDMLDALKGLAAWPQRAAAFSELAQGLRMRDVSAPIATTQVSPESPVARARTPDAKLATDLAETVADGASLQPRDSITRAGTPWILGITAVVSLTALVFFVVWLRASSVEPGATPANMERGSLSADGRQVTISIVGPPPGANVTYDGTAISSNPFRVAPTHTLMPIRVEFPGYEPFVATVIPMRDTTVRVRMRPHTPGGAPTTAAGPGPTAKSPSSHAGPNTRPLGKPAEGQREPVHGQNDEQDDVRKSGRGTFYTEKFE